MGNIKTKKSASKRFWVSGSGKIMRRKAGHSHLLRKKSGARKRRLKMSTPLTSDASRVKKILRVG
ncbi:50S ribosomal protein L35 [Candidatus Calescamantes bacterium]|nr:50S ribosomal protein L35 [Candidatus Calescamantes bacterium]